MVLSSLKNIDSETVQDAVKKHVVENVGTENVQIKVEPASQIGNTFTGNVYRVSYGPAAPTEQQKTESKMIVKVAPQNDYRREHFMSGPCFAREIHVFDEVICKNAENLKSKKILFYLFWFRFCRNSANFKERTASLAKKAVSTNTQHTTK